MSPQSTGAGGGRRRNDDPSAGPRQGQGVSPPPGAGRIRYGGTARRRDPGQRSVARPAQRSRHADRPRALAFEALRAVDEGAYANIDLPRRLRQANLSTQDGAFATELVYGTIRRQGFYDAVIAAGASRATTRIDPDTLAAMRLGAHQILGMRVPDHAAVAETVALARERIGTGSAGFVNAVLRRVSERSHRQWLESLSADAGDDIAALALEDSHPEWIVRALRSALLAHGAATVETIDSALRALLDANNRNPAVALVARPGLCDVPELVQAGAQPGELSPIAAVLSAGGVPGGISAVRQGRAAVQDEGSQLIALALAAVELDPRPAPTAGTDGSGDLAAAAGERWLDVCAGPGGKVALLAALAIDRPVEVFANEVSDHRIELVEQAVAAAIDAGAQVFVGCGDGRTLGQEEPGGFDRVLVDAPCTGLGSLRRRPESRWRRQQDDVAALTRLQAQLLDSGMRATRAGGVIAYSTCSPHVAETSELVAQVLQRHPHVQLLDARPYLEDIVGHRVPDLGEGPYVQLWPHVHGTDAMFLALAKVGVADEPGS